MIPFSSRLQLSTFFKKSKGYWETNDKEHQFYLSRSSWSILAICLLKKANNEKKAEFIYENLMIQSNLIHSAYLCNIKNIGKTVESIINNKIPSGIYNISDNKVYNYNDILSYYNPSFILKIPILLINVIYVLSKLISNRFFHENSIKLISDNIYPSLKMERFIKLNEFLGKK